MNAQQVLATIVPRLDSADRFAIYESLTDAATAEFDHAGKYRLYGATHRPGYHHHMDRWRELTDLADYVYPLLPEHIRVAIDNYEI